jgi:hypothetical protein
VWQRDEIEGQNLTLTVLCVLACGRVVAERGQPCPPARFTLPSPAATLCAAGASLSRSLPAPPPLTHKPTYTVLLTL